MSKSRSISICVSDIPKNRFTKGKNGKIYLNVNTWDYDKRNEYDEDFSVSLPFTDEEKAAYKANPEQKQKINFVGNGRIWKDEPVSDNEPMPFDGI